MTYYLNKLMTYDLFAQNETFNKFFDHDYYPQKLSNSILNYTIDKIKVIGNVTKKKVQESIKSYQDEGKEV